MPELPEVERARRLLADSAVGRRIVRARAVRDPIVFEGLGPVRIRRALEGRQVLAAHRRGKHLFLELDRRPRPLFHLGMTGAIHVPDDGPSPRCTRLELFLEGGRRVAYTTARRLGRVRLREDPLAEPPLSRLGFDPLSDLPGPEAFEAAVARRRASLKGLLLDKSFAAGVGTWMADEVLYQARLDPRRPASSLTPAEIRRMRSAPGRITVRGEPIHYLDLAGRTTAWVPTRQR